MTYMVKTRYRKKGMGGKDWNIPYGTECEARFGGQIITCDGIPVCATHSQDAYDYFVRDDDGNGKLRAELTDRIKSLLEERGDDYHARWNLIWDDEKIRKFKRPEQEDFWIWNYDFYNADISDLKYILAVIQGGIGDV